MDLLLHMNKIAVVIVIFGIIFGLFILYIKETQGVTAITPYGRRRREEAKKLVEEYMPILHEDMDNLIRQRETLARNGVIITTKIS